MTDITDTSAEAVERLANTLSHHPAFRGEMCQTAAAMLRALLAERDAHRDAHAAAQNVLDALYGERDRLREQWAQMALALPVPGAAKQIVGMEDRYEAVITAARAALKETGHD
jgi:hypothetical protein